MPTLNILPELQGLIPPLSEDERRQLIANLRAEGCRDAIVVWQEENAILDGHNRYDICQTYEIPFETRSRSLADRDAAKAWMLRHQLGRRNLSPEQMSYLRGEQYKLEKQDKTQNLKQNAPKGHNDPSDSTAEKLAKEHQVSPKTIKRDAAFAKDVNTIAAVDPEAKQAILSRDTKLAREDVKVLAGLTKESPQAVKNVLAAVKKAKTSKAAKQAVREAQRAALPEAQHEATVKAELEAGKTPEEAVRTALQHHKILTPTPALADAIGEATGRPVTLAATDGDLHDGRAQEEEAARAAQTKRLVPLFDALEALATLPDLEALLTDIPASSASRVAQYLDAALTTLTRFAALWKAHRDEEAHPLQGTPEQTSLVPEVPAELQPLSEPAQALRCGETGPVPSTEAMQDTKQQATQPGAHPDTSKVYLGVLCHRGHDYQGTGQSLRKVSNNGCLQCDAERHRERRQAKRQAE